MKFYIKDIVVKLDSVEQKRCQSKQSFFHGMKK